MLPARPSHGLGRPSHLPPCGRIAQLVEQLTLNQRVLGSSPSASTTLFRCLAELLPSGLARGRLLDQMASMDFDDQIRRYFGTSNLAAVTPEALDAGIERMRVDLGLTKDRGERFALWALLHTLGSAPDLDVAFETEADREAARNFMDLIQGAGGK